MKKLIVPFAIVVLGVAVVWWGPFTKRSSETSGGADSTDRPESEARFLGADSLDRPERQSRFLGADSLDREPQETGFVDATSMEHQTGSVAENSRRRQRFKPTPGRFPSRSATDTYFTARSHSRSQLRRGGRPGTEERQQIQPGSMMADYFGVSRSTAPQPQQRIQPGSMMADYFGVNSSTAPQPQQQIQPGSMMADYFGVDSSTEPQPQQQIQPGSMLYEYFAEQNKNN